MKLASPLVHVLILFVANYCLSVTLIDLSRENETGQPARVKHCRSTRLRCRSRQQDAIALGVCSRPPDAWYPNASAPCASCLALNLGCEPGAGPWRNPTISSAFALFSHLLTTPLLIPGSQLTLSASTLVAIVPRLSFRRPSFHSCGSCASFIPPVSLVEQTRRWSGALKTNGTDDEADRRSRHVESCAHNTRTRDDTRKRSREALRPPQPGWM